VGLSLLWILYRSGVDPVVADRLSAEGVVESVESINTGASPPHKEALVQLSDDGPKVHATIPPAALCFRARL
jgi:hypothetical protein